MSLIDKRTTGLIAWTILLIAGWAIWLLLLANGENAARIWRALLINFNFFTAISAGLVTWPAIILAANGKWPGKSERLAWAAIGFLPASILILILLWFGSPRWVPWYGLNLKHGWLDANFLFIRNMAGLAFFWAVVAWFLKRRGKSRQSAMIPAIIVIIVYCAVFTLIGFDLTMALDPHWNSKIFGGYYFVTGLYSAILLWTFLTSLKPGYSESLRRDFSNLIITFSIIGFYFLFMQLLTIWYENMPRETRFVAPRMNYPGWDNISYILIAFLYVIPVLLFLLLGLKKNRYYQGAVAFLLLAGFWFERWWLITPTFEQQVQFGVIEISCTAGVLGLLGLSMALGGKMVPKELREKELPE